MVLSVSKATDYTCIAIFGDSAAFAATLMHKCLNAGDAGVPRWHCHQVTHSQTRLSTTASLDVPRTLTSFSDRCFYVAEPSWNAHELLVAHLVGTGGSRGQSGHLYGPIRSVNWTSPRRQTLLPHKNGTHANFCLFCVLSTSLNLRTNNGINNILIIDIVCIITSSDSFLAPSLSMTYCTPSDHLLSIY